MAGVALGDIDLHFAWQAWRLRHWAGSATFCGRRGTYGTGLALVARAWFPFDVAAAVGVAGVAGVALGDIGLHFGWQAAGVALGDIDLHFAWTLDFHFAWQAWRVETCTFSLRGRRGAWPQRPSLCVAGVALGDMDLHFHGPSLFATAVFGSSAAYANALWKAPGAAADV